MSYNSNKLINGLEAETTIADTDELVFGDVSDTNRAKKITFANLKTEIVGDDTAFVRKSDYDANTILYATSDNTPVALTVGTNSVVGRVAGNITTLTVDSDLTSVSANDDTVPSAKATKTALDLKANDSAVVKLTGNQSIDGVKTFTSDPIIPDEAYGVGWNGVLEPPTKNAVYDKIESLQTLTTDETISTNTTARTWWTSLTRVDANLGWTISAFSVNKYANGINLDQNTTTTAYINLGGASTDPNMEFGSGIDLKLIYWYMPVQTSVGTSPGGGTRWYFHGLSSATSATSEPDITYTTSKRCGFSHYNAKIYAITCNGTNIESTEVDATDDGEVKKQYQINFTPTGVTYYINGTLVATHTQYEPTSADNIRISLTGYNGAGGSSGFTISNIIIGETFS